MSGIETGSIEIASLTDVGCQRSNNQDNYGEMEFSSGARLLIVADGMGGHAGGATASRVAVAAVESVFASSTDPPDVALRAALEQANREVHGEAQRDTELAGMGTTGVALLMLPDGRAWVANVGDSRAYRMHDGQIEQISLDHSLVAELTRRGVITEEEALVHPRRNEVLRSIGVEPEVEVDLYELTMQPGDQFLLCSDGLSGVVRDEEIAEVMRREPPVEAVRALVAFANERGGPDNVTVQIARIPDESRANLLAEKVQAAEELVRRRKARNLSVTLVVVALLLAAALLFALVGQLDVKSTSDGPEPSESREGFPRE